MGLHISLEKYVTDLLTETWKIEWQLVSTPMDPTEN